MSEETKDVVDEKEITPSGDPHETVADSELPDPEEMTDEELEEQSRIAQSKFKARQASKKVESTERTFSETEVKDMMRRVIAESKNEDDILDDDELEPNTARVSRFKNKFIKAFKNMNDDVEFQPDRVIHAYNIFDEKNRRFIPWVTLVFQDDSELAIPLETILKRASKIECELIETKEIDTSYDFGKVEKQEVKPGEYKKSGSGTYVRAKVTQKKYEYVVKLPNSNETMIVQPEVINW